MFKIYFTAEELVMARLVRYPQEEGTSDLVENALAGHVETKYGWITSHNWDIVKKNYTPCPTCKGHGKVPSFGDILANSCPECRGARAV